MPAFGSTLKDYSATLGQHWLVEYHGCDTAVLADIARIEAIMRGAAHAAGATVVAATFHRFASNGHGHGVSGVVVVEESHLSIHTWPEHGYAAVDVYTCGECLPGRAHEHLSAQLGAERADVLTVQRGVLASRPSMRASDERLLPSSGEPVGQDCERR